MRCDAVRCDKRKSGCMAEERSPERAEPVPHSDVAPTESGESEPAPHSDVAPTESGESEPAPHSDVAPTEE